VSAAVILVVVVVAVWVIILTTASLIAAGRQRRRSELEKRFGPEWDRTVEAEGSRKEAAADVGEQEGS
jgi:hypothetical protein